MSAPPSPSVYKGVPADDQVIEGARGGLFAKVGLGHSMDLLHSPPVDLQIRIDRCDYMHAQFTNGGNNFEEVSSSWQVCEGLGIGSKLYWSQQTEEGSSCDCFILTF